MKQKIKPSPCTLLVFGAVFAVAAIVVGLDAYTGGTPSFEETIGTAAVTVFFVYYLIKFIFAKRIEFDFDSFTVKGKTYRFSEVSEAQISYKRVLIPGKRLHFCTLTRVRIYIRGECVLTFTDDDAGYKEFIGLLKKHRVKFRVKNSLSSWKGEIE